MRKEGRTKIGWKKWRRIRLVGIYTFDGDSVSIFFIKTNNNLVFPGQSEIRVSNHIFLQLLEKLFNIK